MKYITKELLMKVFLSAIGIIAVCGSCSYMNKQAGLPDDHLIEQVVEFIIEDQTGVKVDLTP